MYKKKASQFSMRNRLAPPARLRFFRKKLEHDESSASSETTERCLNMLSSFAAWTRKSHCNSSCELGREERQAPPAKLLLFRKSMSLIKLKSSASSEATVCGVSMHFSFQG